MTARATDPAGRSDEAIGAVSVAGLRGDALANAIMKAETKAKRRVTLSIVGLGWLDESEIETIPAAVLEHTARGSSVGLADDARANDATAAGSFWKRVDMAALVEVVDSIPEAEEDAKPKARAYLKALLSCWPEEDRTEVLKAATIHVDKKSGLERWIGSVEKLEEKIDRGQYAGQPAVRDESCLFAVERIIRRARERGLLGSTEEHAAA